MKQKLRKIRVWLLNLFPYKFQSFTPDETLRDSTSRMYLRQLHNLMKNKQVRNIAVTGDLGVGKSTLIRNYEQKHKPFLYPWQKYLYLSVNDLKIEELDTAPNRLEQAQEKLQQELEVRLLKQLLVVCEKKDIAGCHFAPVPERKSSVIPLIFTVVVILLAAWGLGFLENLAYLNWGVEYEVLCMALVLVLSTVAVWFAASRIHTYYKTPSLSFRFGSEQNGGTAEMSPDAETETLDKYIMDIVYVMETIYEKSGGVLVIEDLDRYGAEVCVPILEKFREINILINQRLRSKYPLRKHVRFRFLYVLRDDIFSEFIEDTPSTVPPSKFFDGLMHIVPQLGYANSVDFLAQKWRRYELDVKFLAEISSYIYDYRRIRAIENEYNLFRCVAKKNCKDLEIDSTGLMAFCIYKHYFTEEYYRIRKEPSNELVQYLIRKELYEIQTDLKRVEIFQPKKPELPQDTKKAMLFSFINFNVLGTMFPGNEVLNLIWIFEKLHKYMDQTDVSDASDDLCLKMVVSEYSYDEILKLLEKNSLQTDEFKLIFAIYLVYFVKYVKKSDEREQIFAAQENLLKKCEKTNEKRFALCYAMALNNSTTKVDDLEERIKIADRLKTELFDKYQIAEIALRYSMALYNATNKMNISDHILKIADRIQNELLDKYQTVAIALECASVLLNATTKISTSEDRLKTANRIRDELLTKYPTAEIAEVYAKTLFNAAIKTKNAEKTLEIADSYYTDLLSNPALWSAELKTYYRLVIDIAKRIISDDPIQCVLLEDRLQFHESTFAQFESSHPSP